MLKGLEIKKIDPYKASSGILGGIGGFFVAKKKGYDTFHTMLLILFGSSLGMLLPDLIDGFRQKDSVKTNDLVEEKKDVFVNHIKKNLVWVILGLVIAYFLTQKDRHNNKQLAIIGLFVVVFTFFLKETMSKTTIDEIDENSFTIFNSKIDSELALFGLILGLLVAYSKGGESTELLLFPLVGLGGGMLLASTIKKKAKDNEFSETIEEQSKGINKKRKKTKLILQKISNSIASKTPDSKKQKIRDKFTKIIDPFIISLNERQLVVMEKIHNSLEDELKSNNAISCNKILDILQSNKMDEKDIETFFQVAQKFNLLMTGKTLDSSKIGKSFEFVLRRKTQEYELDDKDFLKPTGVVYQAGEPLLGRERWIWLSSIIEDKNVRKQVRLIEVGKGKYIFHIGVDKL